MSALVTFLIGLLCGTLITYLLMRRRAASGIASHMQKQQSEKYNRKEKILALIREEGSTTNNDVENLLGVSDASATNYLQELEREGKIEQVGQRGRFVTYRKRD
jgi:Fic family protein